MFPSRVILCLLSPPSPTASSFRGFCLLPQEPNCVAHPTLLSYGEKFSPARLLAPNVNTPHTLLCLGRPTKIPLTGWLTLQTVFSHSYESWEIQDQAAGQFSFWLRVLFLAVLLLCGRERSLSSSSSVQLGPCSSSLTYP